MITEKIVNNADNLNVLSTPKQVDANLLLAAINTPQVSQLEELVSTASNIASVDYYEFFHKDAETYRYQPLDYINGQGFW